jgi:chromosome segregation ATPase
MGTMNNTLIKIFALLLLITVLVQYNTESGFFKTQSGYEKIRLAIEYILHGANGPLDKSRHDGELTALRLEDTTEDLNHSQREVEEKEAQNLSLQDENILLRLEGQSNTNEIFRLKQKNDTLDYQATNLKGRISGLEVELDAALAEAEVAEGAREALERKLSELPAIADNLKMTEAALADVEVRVNEAEKKLNGHREAEQQLRSLSYDKQMQFKAEILKAKSNYDQASEAAKRLRDQVEKMEDSIKLRNNPPGDFLDPK